MKNDDDNSVIVRPDRPAFFELNNNGRASISVRGPADGKARIEPADKPTADGWPGGLTYHAPGGPVLVVGAFSLPAYPPLATAGVWVVCTAGYVVVSGANAA